MLVRSFLKVLRVQPSINFEFSSLNPKKLNTEVFHDLPYSKIADPRYAKALIIKPIHMHSRVSQRSLYHRKRVTSVIRTCFSQKKYDFVDSGIEFSEGYYYSDLLGQNVHVTLSNKASRCIRKMGSFDNYILCTKPKDLDSKLGQYLRSLMLRKVNDEQFRVPYVIGTNRKLRIKKYQRHLYLQDLRKVKIPKEFRDNYRTLQRSFGKTADELNNQDYGKYIELQNLKKTLGDELEPTHPLLQQLKEKLTYNILTNEQQAKFQQMSKDIEENFVNDPKHGVSNRKRVEKAKASYEALSLKMQEHKFKINDLKI